MHDHTNRLLQFLDPPPADREKNFVRLCEAINAARFRRHIEIIAQQATNMPALLAILEGARR